MTIRILLADDQFFIQECVKSILKDETDIEIVGTARNGVEAIAFAKRLQPDIVLLDVEMPKINGIDVTKHICQLLPNTKIIMLSSHNNQEYITQSLAAGASSYLLKESFIGDLKQAIYSLSRGYAYIEAKLLNQALNNAINSQHKTTKIEKYRRCVYVPAKIATNSRNSRTQTSNKDRYSKGISQTDLASTLNRSLSGETKTVNRLTTGLPKTSVPSTVNISRQKKHRKRLILGIFAIAGLILSILIF